MLKTTLTALTAALALGAATGAHAQRNLTDGGDIHSGAHTGKSVDPHTDGARTGRFDPYTQAANQSTRSDLAPAGKTADPYTDGARAGKADPYTDGAKAGKADPFTDGARK